MCKHWYKWRFWRLFLLIQGHWFKIIFCTFGLSHEELPLILFIWNYMSWCIIHVTVDFCAFICLIFLHWVQNIDVDQIVEQYQSTCTPQPSISKLPPITPTVDKNFGRQDESCLPSELCSNCSHGLQVCVAYLLCSISILICCQLDMPDSWFWYS